MMRRIAAAIAISAALGLAGCQTGPQGSGVRQGVQVTRFHLGQPIARGEIRVEPADPAAAGSLVFVQQAAALERELARLGWTINRGNARTEQVAVMDLRQGSREALRNRPSLSLGMGGGTSNWGRSSVGVGVGATVPIGGPASGTLVATELAVRIQRRSDATVAWEGRAQLEARAGAPLANPVAAAGVLAEALFRDFPGESGQTIRLR